MAAKLGEDGIVALLVEARDRSQRKRALTSTFLEAMTAALRNHGYTATPLRDGTGVECPLATKEGTVRTRHRLTHLAALSGRETPAGGASASTGSSAVVSGGGTAGGVTLASGTITVIIADAVPSER